MPATSPAVRPHARRTAAISRATAPTPHSTDGSRSDQELRPKTRADKRLEPEGERRLVDGDPATRVERGVEEVRPRLGHRLDGGRVVRVAVAVLAEAPREQHESAHQHAGLGQPPGQPPPAARRLRRASDRSGAGDGPSWTELAAGGGSSGSGSCSMVVTVVKERAPEVEPSVRGVTKGVMRDGAALAEQHEVEQHELHHPHDTEGADVGDRQRQRPGQSRTSLPELGDLAPRPASTARGRRR